MKININSEKLAQAIKEAEGKAKARTVTDEDIRYALSKIGENLPKKCLSGTKVFYDGAEHFPSAYKYIPESTHWEAENVNGRWYVTNIYRDRCPNRSESNTRVQFSEEAKMKIIEKASILSL